MIDLLETNNFNTPLALAKQNCFLLTKQVIFRLFYNSFKTIYSHFQYNCIMRRNTAHGIGNIN